METPPAWPPVRHPFQVTSMGAFSALGAAWLFQGASPTLHEILGDPWVQIWSVILLVGGVCGLVAALTARSDEGLSLLTERIALLGVGGYCAIYVGGMIGSHGLGPWATETVFALFIVACIWRYVQVQKRINWNKRVGRDARMRWRR